MNQIDKFVAVIESKKGMYFSIGRSLGFCTHTIEDIYQDSFYELLKKASFESLPIEEQTKLFNICFKRNLIDEITKNKRRNTKSVEERLKLMPLESDLRKEIEDRNLKEHFSDTLNSMKDKPKLSISMYLEGYSQKEIAKVLNTSVGTVKDYLIIGKDFLKKKFRF